MFLQQPAICPPDCLLNFITMIGSLGLRCIRNKLLCGQIAALAPPPPLVEILASTLTGNAKEAAVDKVPNA